MPHQLKEQALFIADAHYPHHGDMFLELLKKIENQTIQTPQLFLMGDIFDLLFGHNNYIKTFSLQAIERIQKLSKSIEIIYLEGNHDFCLKEIFPNVKVYSRKEQPIHYKLKNQDIYLAHGDLYQTGFGYNLYSKLLRNKTTLTLLKPFQKQIINHRMRKLKTKKICGDFIHYQKRFDAIRNHYPKNALIIEGHFHQAVVYKNYISLPSLACQGEVGVIENAEMIFKKL